MTVKNSSIKDSPIAVLGAGSWGTALAIALAKNGQVVHLWDRVQPLLADISAIRQNARYLPDVPLPDNIVICNTLALALEQVKDILLVVPSHGFAEALQSVKPFLTPAHRIAWGTKGLEPETGHFLNQVAERELGAGRPYAVISGPSFAKEVAIGLPTAVTVASINQKFADELAVRFSQDSFSVYTTDDIIGVQLGGVVKNVLAVAVGISDGVQFGANARAALITRGLNEMMRLGEVLGARRETLMGLAGCGDVILTCTDNQSRNRRFGLALAEGLTEAEALNQIGQVVEAVYNVGQLCGLAKREQIELPIVEQVFRIMKQGVSPREALKVLFKRAPERESLTN
ncbi:MAG TPA: NAD(P)H-dependent glycerol-3-phosphate dehydrogenase [Gammaproteobacteria bacterium]|nr:NAD(P)H-dependent glycerol-3-phosphate dehydrogenase [Gammaproteobacteria bacterium]HRA42776.1 NAD(P)H-dependent glycerol-3-phosphate dehydrogenase [Gammaproteobacteria bacterium]